MSSTLRISNISPDTTLDDLRFFFENTWKSGGGTVCDIEINHREHTALVMFEEQDVVERILQREQITFQGQPLEVEAFDTVKAGSSITGDCCFKPGDFCIHVTGYNPSNVTDETLLNYFESRKGANSNVVKALQTDEGKACILQFEIEEAANIAFEKKHRIGDRQLTVKRYHPAQPLPNYTDKVLITGINDSTKRESLLNFIESKSNKQTTDVEYGCRKDKAIITFDQDIDIEKLRKSCLQVTLDGRYLKIKNVSETNCVIVTGYSKNTSLETIETYFENKRRSGVENVTKVSMNDTEGYCLVYLEDPASVAVVNQRTHALQTNELTVKPFHECLGIDTPTKRDQPETHFFLQVKGINSLILDYLTYAQNQKQLDTLLLPLNVCVDWHNFSERGFQIEKVHSTANQQVNFHQNEELIKQIESIVLEYLQSIKVCQHEVPKQIWHDTYEHLQAMKTEDTIIKMDEEKLIVSAIGRNAQHLTAQITDTLKRNYTKKDQIKLELHEIILLSYIKDQLFDESDGINVTFDHQNCLAVFAGREENIKIAMVKILQSTRQIVRKDVVIASDGHLRFLKIPEVEEFLNQIFLQEKIMATWSVFEETVLKIYASSENDLKKAELLFQKSILDEKITLEKNQLYCIQTGQWDDLVNSNEKTQGDQVVRVERQDSFIQVFATSTFDISPLFECICHFITKNSIHIQTIPLPEPACKLLRDAYKEEISSVQNDRQKDHIIKSINVYESEVEVTGNESGLNKASREIRSLVSSIHEREFQLNKKGIAQHIQSPEGKTKISHIERSKGVAFEVNEDKSVDFGSDIPHFADAPTEISRFHLKSGQTIITVKGDITDLDVEVIVTSANATLKGEGGLAQIIDKKGGEQIQNECQDFLQGKMGENKLLEGEVCCTSGGDLKCKMVVHAVGPVYSEEKQNTDLLAECIRLSLEKTTDKQYTSIAFPAIAIGSYNYPEKDACKVIVKSINTYLSKIGLNSTIKEIYLCDLEQKRAGYFTTALEKVLKKSQLMNVSPDRKRLTKRTTKQKAVMIDDPSVFGTLSLLSSPIVVRLIKGDISRQKVEVIVNSTSQGLDLSKGLASKALLQAGGPRLQDECIQQYPNGLPKFCSKYVVVTSGGRLNCKFVYHIALTPMSTFSQDEIESVVVNCLSEANKQRLASVAFPALGSGTLGYDRFEVARAMFSAVDKFGKQNRQTNVVDVRFIIYDKDTEALQAFDSLNILKKQVSNLQGLQSNSQSMEQILMEFEHVKLKIYVGTLRAADVNAIVNFTTANYNLIKAKQNDTIESLGGDELEREFKVQRANMIKDSIAVTTAGGGMNFNCDCIIHLDSSDRDLKKGVTKAIMKTEELQLHSVAFSVEAITEMGFSLDQVADIFSQVIHHVKKTYVEMNIVCSSQELVDLFVSHLEHSICSFEEKRINILSKPKNALRPARKIKVMSYTTISMKVFAKNDTIANTAITELQKLLHKDFKETPLDNVDIKFLSEDEIIEIQNIQMEMAVEIEINQNIGRIKIIGLQINVTNAVIEVDKILRRSCEIRFAKEHARFVSGMVQWFFLEVNSDGEKLVEYPAEISLKLEEAVRGRKQNAEFYDAHGEKYIVDFSTYEEYVDKDPNNFVKVIRKIKLTGAAFELPTSWANMDEKENIKVVLLQQNDPDYRKIEKSFKLGTGGKYRIVQIEKIQNRQLHQQYMAKKLNMENESSAHNTERILWHGTAYNAIDSINTYGFNRSYCGKNATAFGMGVYFAQDVSYSANDTYSPPDHKKQKNMYMCKVLVGDFTQGDSSFKVPPPKGKSHILYDSVVNDVQKPTIFVIFQDAQAYPEYLIKFVKI